MKRGVVMTEDDRAKHVVALMDTIHLDSAAGRLLLLDFLNNIAAIRHSLETANQRYHENNPR